MKNFILSGLRWLTASALFLGFSAPVLAWSDSTPPTVGAVTPINVTVGVSATFSGSYSDNADAESRGLGVVHCQLVFDGGTSLGATTLSVYGSGPGTATRSYAITTTGSHTMQLQCEDGSGNWGYGAVTTVYANPPGSVSSVSPTTATVGSAVTLSVTYSGMTAPYTVNSCYLVIDGGTVYPVMTLSAPGASSGTASKSYTFTTAGAHTARVSCNQNSAPGNFNYGPDTTITVSAPDGTAPTVGAITPTSGTAGVLVVYSATYSDAVGVTQCQLVEGATNHGTMALSGGTATYSIALSAGTHNLQAQCRDAAANWGYGSVTAVTLTSASDGTAPSVSQIALISPIQNVGTLVSATYTDAVGVTACTLYVNGTDWGTMSLSGTTSGTASKNFAFNPSGTHSVYVTCRDAAGNVGTGAVRTITVSPPVADAIPPVVGIPTPNTATVGVSVTFTASASDNISINYCQLYVNGVLDGYAALPVGGNTWKAYTFTSGGTYQVQFRCADSVGNMTFGPAQSVVVSGTTTTGPGRLIKLVCPAGASSDHPCKAVYYVGSDGKRHAFPNDKAYFTWYSDFSSVQEVSDAAMASYPLGLNVTYRPGTRMVKFQTVPTVYAVARGGILRPIASEAVAIAIYGVLWNRQIDDVSEAFYTNYRFGSAVNSSSDFIGNEAFVASSIDANF